MARERMEARLPGDDLVDCALLQYITRLFPSPSGHTNVSGVDSGFEARFSP